MSLMIEITIKLIYTKFIETGYKIYQQDKQENYISWLEALAVVV